MATFGIAGWQCRQMVKESMLMGDSGEPASGL